MVSVERNLTPQQIEFAAEYIVENSWIYSLEDLQICFDRGCMGKYGELYNRLDPSVIMGWLGKYEQERNLVIAEQRQKDILTNNIYDVFNNDTMRDALKIVVQKMDERKVEQMKSDEPHRKPSQFEEQIMDEWTQLPSGKNGVMKIYKHQIFDFTGYREFRYNEEIYTSTK